MGSSSSDSDSSVNSSYSSSDDCKPVQKTKASNMDSLKSKLASRTCAIKVENKKTLFDNSSDSDAPVYLKISSAP